MIPSIFGDDSFVELLHLFKRLLVHMYTEKLASVRWSNKRTVRKRKWLLKEESLLNGGRRMGVDTRQVIEMINDSKRKVGKQIMEYSEKVEQMSKVINGLMCS